MTDVVINLRPGLELIVKRRKGNTSTRVEILVNKDAVVEAGVIEPAPPDPVPPDPTPPPVVQMPTLEDERNTYRKWGWTWPASAETVTDPMPTYSVWHPDVHNDTEGDDLWTYLMQHIRTGNAVYMRRAQAWAQYFKADYRNDIRSQYEKDYGLDHLYGIGLVEWSINQNDPIALDAAKVLAADLDWWYGPDTTFGCYKVGACMHYGLRAAARHLLLLNRVAEATGDSHTIAMRDKILGYVLTSPNWNGTYGMYFVGDYTTDGSIGDGAYARGVRVQSAFQLGLLVEALYQTYRVTGRDDVKARIVALAKFVHQFGLDATYQYTGSWFGILNGAAYHNYSDKATVTFWDPVYTTSLVNTLVYGFKLSGDRALLDSAKRFFNRGTKGVYGSPTARTAADDVVHHFVDTRFDSSDPRYLDYNKGELQYTYQIFDPNLSWEQATPMPNSFTVPAPGEYALDTDPAVTLDVAQAGTYNEVVVPVPVDCVLSEWSAWSAWSPCVNGQQSRTRTRTVVTPPSNGGAACGPLTETETQACTPPPPSSAVFTANLAQGGQWQQTTEPPAYESVHLMEDERIAEIGWIGLHSTEFSNEVRAFNPANNTIEQITPWVKQVSATDQTLITPPTIAAGWNRNHPTYDNHPSAYFASTKTLVWFGHGVIDVPAKAHIRGNRYPMTQSQGTYVTGNATFSGGNIYNPAYVQCLERDEVAFFGSSAGGTGNKKGLIVCRHTGPVDAPWQMVSYDLSATGIRAMERARNNAACVGHIMYVGGGTYEDPTNPSKPNYELWSIDLANITAVKVADGFPLETWPQMVYDSFRGRLIVIGKKVNAFDLASKTWSEIVVSGWPTAGYKSVGGAYIASRDAIYFRGTPTNYNPNTNPGTWPWQWNRIQFS